MRGLAIGLGLGNSVGIARTIRHEHPLQARHQFLEYLQALGAQHQVQIRHPGGVATGVGIGFDQARPDGIAHTRKNDRDGGGRRLSCLDLGISDAEDDVHTFPHQRLGRIGKEGDFPLHKAHADDEILIFPVTQCHQPVAQARDVRCDPPGRRQRADEHGCIIFGVSHPAVHRARQERAQGDDPPQGPPWPGLGPIVSISIQFLHVLTPECFHVHHLGVSE